LMADSSLGSGGRKADMGVLFGEFPAVS